LVATADRNRIFDGVKVLKVVGIVVLALLLLAVAGLALLFVPGVQRSLALRALEQPGREVAIERVALGWGGMELRAVQIREAGQVIELGAARAEFSLWQILTGGTIDIASVEATGVLVDLTGAAPPAGPQETAEPFDGLLALADLPADLRIGRLQASGSVLLPAVAGQPRRLDFQLEGSGVARGSRAEFRFVADYTEGEPGPDAASANLEGTAAALHDAAGAAQALNVQWQARSRGLGLPESLPLAGSVVAERTDQGERYRINVAAVSGQRRENLADVRAELDRSTDRLAGSWQIAASREQLEAMLPGDETPRAAATGQGTFATDRSFVRVEAEGSLAFEADELERVRPELKALGGLRGQARFSILREGSVISARELQVALADGQGRPALDATLLRPFTLDTGTLALNATGADGELLRVALLGLPTAWLAAVSGVAAQGEPLVGSLVVNDAGEGFTARIVEPLVAREFSLSLNGEPMVDRLDLEIRGRGEFGPAGAKFELTQQMGSKGRALGVLQTTGSFDPKSGAIAFAVTSEGDLAGLLNQPFGLPFNNLSRGRFTARVDGQLQDGWRARGELRLVDLVSLDGEASLAELTVPFDAQGSTEGVVDASLTARMRHAQPVYEAAVRANLRTNGELQTLSAKVESQRLEMAHLQGLSVFFNPDDPPGTPAPGPDTEPFWGGLIGRVTFAIGEIVSAERSVAGSITGDLVLEANRLFFEDLRIRITDTPATVQAEIVFLTDRPQQPYRLEAAIDANGVNVGQMLTRLEPGRPPALEGFFSINGKFQSDGAYRADLFENLRGDLVALSDGGVFRGLQQQARGAALAGGILQAVTGRQNLAFISDLAEVLGEVRYQRIEARASRDENLNINVQTVELVAPQLYLRGSGMIRSQAGVPLAEQPMNFSLQLGAAGRLESMLSRVNLVSPERNELGFAPMGPSFPLRGSLARPDASELWSTLGRAAASALVRGLAPDQPTANGDAQQAPNGQQARPPATPVEEIETIFRGVRDRLRGRQAEPPPAPEPQP
jgi:hypothetical protein